MLTIYLLGLHRPSPLMQGSGAWLFLPTAPPLCFCYPPPFSQVMRSSKRWFHPFAPCEVLKTYMKGLPFEEKLKS